ncbi:DNA-binding transcriptional LysR family regulator [Paucibacter oligotrophus]|uniref:DNA-binding transcriptional LysR family regulator n=1 Tax=Roseateles oligotrophus TaxID=1769250 RepID=A0A840LAK7_9BURK|nr:LysR family transcriptional regulator [Roseateles oligotrophus]MBB4845614.1 DNA-binding transcriptional LysR family regulator [Roseateles oligotrophus]
MSRNAAIDWDDLRIALAITESGTLSGAAAALHISHPTLSRRLQLMERRLGTRLFERSPGGLRPTAAGEEVRALALRFRDEIAGLERRVGGRDDGHDGPVRVTAPDAVSEYLLPGVLAAVCRTHSGLQLELHVSNDIVSLARREADIALRVTRTPQETLRGREVGTVAMAIYAPRQLAEAGEAAAQPLRLPWVGFDGGLACSAPGNWLARNVATDAVRFRANTLLGAAQAARAGIGCAVLPCFVGGSIPELLRLGPPLDELAQPLWLLMHEDVARVPRMRRASAALSEEIASSSRLMSGLD